MTGSIEEPRNDATATLLYDGQCAFCRKQIETLRRLDSGKRIRFLSLHDDRVRTEFPQLSYDQLMEQMWIVTCDGRSYGGADAVRYLTRTLPILYPFAPLLHFPGLMPIWRFLYQTVARYRYRIAGRTCDDAQCQLHSAKASNKHANSAKHPT